MTAPIAALHGLSALAFATLLWITRGSPEVPATVTGDPSPSRLEGEGVVLHGRVAVPKSAPLFVVLHGGPGGDHRSLLALKGLNETHRVLFYDQRGAGLSERVAPDRLGVSDHLADLDALIAAHGQGPVGADRPFLGRCWRQPILATDQRRSPAPF
ncbi:alpha/beta fold hydrolase [Limimaricola cinnabarinus]|uniref:alpha/beta fold hydrolase n=1 Tax=Limimaricola cinnabarinus TaxID=1125964 RepID=UPI0034E1C5EE